MLKSLYENIPNARNYTKNANTQKGKITGYGLKVSHIENLAVVDVDIKGKDKMAKEEKQKVSDKLFEKIRKFNFSHVVRTASGGAHIYCNVDYFDLKGKERITQILKAFPDSEYDFDIFANVRTLEKHMEAFVLLFESKIKYKGSDEIFKYELAIGDPNKPVEPSLEYVLECFEITEHTKNKIERLTGKQTKNKTIINLNNTNGLTISHVLSLNSLRKKFNKRNVHLTKDLLDVILLGFTVENFGKTEVIHAHTTENIKISLGNVNLVSAIKSIELMNADLETDEQFNIKGILEYFCNSEVLTPKARRCLVTDYENYELYEESLCYVDWMVLVYILKYHANKYYVEHLSEDFMTTNGKFIHSTTSWKNFITNTKKYDSIIDLINDMSECVAVIGGNKQFVVKEIVKKRLTLVKYNRTEFLSMANGLKIVKTTKTEREKMKSKKKKVEEYKYFNLDLIVKRYDLLCKLPSFEEWEIYTSDKNTLSLYQPPPATKYNSELIKNWVEFIKSLVEPDYIPALNELFSSISYKLRNPDSFIRKFFVQYGQGNDGKSYLISCLEKIFYPFCNTGIKFGQMTKDQFNDWTVKCLLLWMEEVQGNRENVDILQLSELVKQMTTPQVSIRPMYGACKLGENIGIVGLNTNQKDLKGLTRSDDATKSRLVIIKYQGCVAYENDANFDFDEKCLSFINHPDFTWSLYYYLMYEHEIPKGFKTNRYYGKEKEEFIIEANRERKRPIEAFLSDIKMVNEDEENNTTDELNNYEQNILCITYKKGTNKDKEVVLRFKTNDFNITYNRWKNENGSYPVIRDITLELEKKGFIKIKYRGYYFYVITKNDFESLLKEIKKEVEDDCEDYFNFD